MPAKGTPFTVGLQGKIFWGLYVTPDTPYDLAKHVYGVSSNPPTAKIYPLIKEMKKTGFVKKDRNGKYHVNIDKIIEKFENDLQRTDVKLDDESKIYFSILLNSQICRKNFGETLETLKFGTIPSQEQSIFSLFTTHLSTSAATVLFQFEKNPHLKNPLQRYVRTINRVLMNKNKKAITMVEFYETVVKTSEHFSNDPDSIPDIEVLVKKYADRYRDSQEILKKYENVGTVPQINKNLAALYYNFSQVVEWLPEKVLQKMVMLKSEISTYFEMLRMYATMDKL